MGKGIAIIDFGSQYTHLIARRIRELSVYSEILPPDIKITSLKDYEGIILSGGPDSIYKKGSAQIDPKILQTDIPILGICYGLQFITHHLKGKVTSNDKKEYGLSRLKRLKENPILKSIPDENEIWMSHGDSVIDIPDGFEIIAKTKDDIIAAISDEKKNIFGLQFHPEVTHTKNGLKILDNFITTICGCKKDWDMDSYYNLIKKDIEKKTEGKKVFLLVSGGVDSTVCFSLLNKILGENKVYGLHIDNGFMRKDESEKVKSFLNKSGFNNFHIADYEKEFLQEVKGISDPEEKRKKIGNYFIKAQQQELKKLGLDPKNWLLGQGTIYPDTIESNGTKNSDLIKTHHNRVQIIQDMIDKGKVIEPIAMLYKDEVRKLGKTLDIPDELLSRHPFPGPGLAIRCLCSGKEQPTSKDYIKDIIRCNKTDHEFTVLPIKSVGVQGDERSYKNCAALEHIDDWNRLSTISTDITNNIHNINRVVSCIYQKHRIDPKIKEAYLTKNRLDLLREIDEIVMDTIKKHGIDKDIWQFPVILLPIGHKYFESIVLRPVSSKEAMTAKFFRMPKKILDELIEKISRLNIDNIYYDITNKPPGTIEWE